MHAIFFLRGIFFYFHSFNMVIKFITTSKKSKGHLKIFVTFHNGILSQKLNIEALVCLVHSNYNLTHC